MEGQADEQAFQGAGYLGLETRFRHDQVGPEKGPGAGGIAFQSDEVGLQFVRGEKGRGQAEGRPEGQQKNK